MNFFKDILSIYPKRFFVMVVAIIKNPLFWSGTKNQVSSAINDFMASDFGDSKLLAKGSNLLAIKVTRYKLELFIHLRTFIPRHSKVPPMPKTVKYVSGIKC